MTGLAMLVGNKPEAATFLGPVRPIQALDVIVLFHIPVFYSFLLAFNLRWNPLSYTVTAF